MDITLIEYDTPFDTTDYDKITQQLNSLTRRERHIYHTERNNVYSNPQALGDLEDELSKKNQNDNINNLFTDYFVEIAKNRTKAEVKNVAKSLNIFGKLFRKIPMEVKEMIATFVVNSSTDQEIEKITNIKKEFHKILFKI